MRSVFRLFVHDTMGSLPKIVLYDNSMGSVVGNVVLLKRRMEKDENSY